MARLIVQPGSPTAREFSLKTGANSFGRGPANDFQLDDPSVSGSHCQIIIEGSKVVLRDLGSTNGTYVNRAPVKEAVLQNGQTLHLGGLELMFYSDAPTAAPVARPAGAPSLPPPRAVAPSGVARIPAPAGVARIPSPPPPTAAPAVEAPPTISTPTGPCKHHPKMPGRHFCSHCQLLFCDACVTTRAQKKFCRACGSACVPVRAMVQRPAAGKGFFARFPGAFIYPFRGAGVMWLILSAIVLSFARFLTGVFWIYIPIVIVAYGYIFSFMQNIIHATANEEEEMPGLPGLDDVFGGAFRLAAVVLICFALPIAFAVLKFFDVYDVPASALIATMVLGCLYFPMAFLAVAIKDTALAANPLVVIPAILKVPLGYLVTCLVVIGIFALRQLSDAATGAAGYVSQHTRDMSVMFMSFGLKAVLSLVNVYLLTVSMRTLGLLYVTNKRKFGWFDH